MASSTSPTGTGTGAGNGQPQPAPPKPSWDPRETPRSYPWLRPTIRIRLTLLYGGMFLIAGMVLLTIIYLLAAQALDESSQLPFRILNGNAQPTSDRCPGLTGTLPSEVFMQRLSACADAQRRMALDGLLRRSLLALLGLAVAAFAFGYVMAGRVLSPLGRITRTARQVAYSDLHKRIELEGPDDELKELSDTFDDMLDRLDRAFTAQQRFVANASHELRTPLAINRTLLEVQLADPQASPELQQLGKTLLATNERSEQLVEGLLLLARSENELVDRKPIDLAEVASQAVEQTRGEAENKGVEMRGVRQPTYAQGNGVLLERVALNLVQNAVRYNLREGDGSRSVRRPSRARLFWSSRTPGPSYPRMRWTTSSSPSGVFAQSGRAATRGSGSGCRSCGPWRVRTGARCPRSPVRTAAW